VNRTAAAVAALVVVVVSSAPACKCAGADAKSVESAGTVLPPDPGYYAVENWDGRIYVFGDQKTHDNFAKTHELQIRKTFIGAGPGGETVMFEAQDKVPAMTKRIIDRWSTETGVKLE
jgi:hypothetical protein